MELLCLGDIAIIRDDPAFCVWEKLDCLSSGNDQKVLLNWELPIGLRINSSARTSGSRFTSSLNSIDIIRSWAPGIATLATNHAMDADGEGLLMTITELKSIGFMTVGAGMSFKEKATPLTWETEEGKLAIFNWVFPDTHPDCNTVPGPNCWPGMENVKNQINQIRNQVDWILAVLHWGDELFPYPTLQQRKIASGLFNCEVDAIIGHHPHVVRGMELIDGRPVFYSIGNFFFNISGKNPGSSNLHRAPRNNEALGVKWTFKRGNKPIFKIYSFWAKELNVIPDIQKRAEKRLLKTSLALQKYHGNKYLEWYNRKKTEFFSWGAKWHFGVLAIGLREFFPYILKKIANKQFGL